MTDNHPKGAPRARLLTVPVLAAVLTLAACFCGTAAAANRPYYITESRMTAVVEEKHAWGGSVPRIEILDAACAGQGYAQGRFPYERYHLFLCYLTAAGGWHAQYHITVQRNATKVVYTPTLVSTYRLAP